MRTKNFLKHLILGALLLTAGKVVGQVTTASNVAGGPTDFLGWDNTGTNNFPLMVRHDLNQPIEWYTDAIRRMLLRETATYMLGSFPGQVKDGSLLICPKVDNFTPAGPFSLLHLAASLSRVVPLA